MRAIAFATVLTLATQLALAQVELSIPSVHAAAGSAVVVPVTIKNGQNLTAIQFSVNFDASRLSVADDKSILPGDLLADHTVASSRTAGQTRTVVFSSSLAPLKSGAGIVARVILQVAATASTGQISVQLSDVLASDTTGKSVAVTSTNGNVVVGNGTNTPGAGENQLTFPQIANGSFSGGGFNTSLIFVNRTAATSTVQLSFFKSDGTPFVVTLKSGQSGSSFVFTLRASGSIFLQTDGNGPLSAGYARLVSTGPVGGTLLFSSLDGAGQTVSEAGVDDSPPGTRFSVPVLKQGAINTGIAFANTSAQAIQLTLALKDEQGAQQSSSIETLSAGQHLARFSHELFSSLNSVADFKGSIEVTASAPISAVALKLGGSALATFPVVTRAD